MARRCPHLSVFFELKGGVGAVNTKRAATPRGGVSCAERTAWGGGRAEAEVRGRGQKAEEMRMRSRERSRDTSTSRRRRTSGTEEPLGRPSSS
jgi:hypothetical protein